jgi:methyl-accepting chemotaxis protein
MSNELNSHGKKTMGLFTSKATIANETMKRDLKNLKERYELLDEASGIGLWEAYLPKARFDHPEAKWTWSAEMRRLMGFETELEFPNVMEAWSDRVHPDDAPRVFEAFAGHLKDKTGSTRYKVIYRLKMRDGSYRWVRATGGCRYQADGETVRTCGSLADIHEEVMLQERSKEVAIVGQEAVAALRRGLEALAKGNLEVAIEERLATEFEPLRLDFNASVRNLATAMSSIHGSIAVIENGSNEIAAGASDLSRRTEQQAASLEQTAAALDEITSNVSNSNSRTEEARTVASEANKSATKSVEVASHAEDAMRKIEESSQQISNIIGVIDEIAFQTNLLALNAGVEAARAGDAGKGFAVVAQEVRELAQRSAQAAKEIKGLILNSSNEVQGGVKLVRDVGEALKTIGSFIGNINSHMEAIATASKEQSVGLAEVNKAINSMDQATQQNAAMVQQSTAASDSLNVEVVKLRELVAQFDLEEARTASRSASLHRVARTMAQPSRQSASAQAPSANKKAAGGGNWQEF